MDILGDVKNLHKCTHPNAKPDGLARASYKAKLPQEFEGKRSLERVFPGQ